MGKQILSPENDLPPAYSPPTVPAQTQSQNEDDLLRPTASYDSILGGRPYHSLSSATRATSTVTLWPEYSQDASVLADFVTEHTELPPRPHISIHGEHSDSGGSKNNKSKVVDFDFQIDLTRSVIRHGDSASRWTYTSCISDNDGQKAYRGGRWRSSGPSAPSGRIALPTDDTELPADTDLESGNNDTETTSEAEIKMWSARFCNDPASVKSFTFTRSVNDFDYEVLRRELTGHLRSLNYEGTITIEPVLLGSRVTVYSPHWINKLRNNAFAFWACIILQLWILTWPVIWLLEKRYEVVRTQWLFSRTSFEHTGERISEHSVRVIRHTEYAAGKDEMGVAEMWAPVVRQAAWEKKLGGCTLVKDEISALKARDEERRARAQTGGNEWVERTQAVMGVARGLMGVPGGSTTTGGRGGWGRDRNNSRNGALTVSTGNSTWSINV
ncbi:uncharacterized protein BDW47DRAFT_56474 [Aspergillus candidus]|uniref:Uncharacterized protein n=1 Tax=Aspergillus candidus TaxID=41067 RepID=A0A2I2FLW6_ASPCN|nr:hypothetical protein BDW47DRAFT_56474 [Aspergillus candidus]PLB41594.1 hypothetical protein BDW47DRAFT_56474 [Aspergillus candidus]